MSDVVKLHDEYIEENVIKIISMEQKYSSGSGKYFVY